MFLAVFFVSIRLLIFIHSLICCSQHCTLIVSKNHSFGLLYMFVRCSLTVVLLYLYFCKKINSANFLWKNDVGKFIFGRNVYEKSKQSNDTLFSCTACTTVADKIRKYIKKKHCMDMHKHGQTHRHLTDCSTWATRVVANKKHSVANT